MKLIKTLKDKKGAALEMAIFFMIIVFCFCTLLTTMTLTARSRIKIEKAYFNIDLTTDKVVEEYLLYLDDFQQKVLVEGAAWDPIITDQKINDNDLKIQCGLITNDGKTSFEMKDGGVDEKFYIFRSNPTPDPNVTEEFKYQTKSGENDLDSITCNVTIKKSDGTYIKISVLFLRLEDAEGNAIGVSKSILSINKYATN